MEELKVIIEKFASCGWELISAVKEADSQCGSCGCEFDPLYKKALNLLSK